MTTPIPGATDHIAGIAAAIVASASASTLVAIGTGASIGRFYNDAVLLRFASFAGLALAALRPNWTEKGYAARPMPPG